MKEGQALTPALSHKPESGKRKEPRWVVAFLRALERTGQARSAAVDSGIDFSTAYARRRAHGEFAQAWAEALAAHRARVRDEEEAEIAAVGKKPPLPARALRESPSPADRGAAEVVVSAGKVRRAGAGRWSKRKEAVFFEELAATANIRMAADGAGVSTNAILARRHKSRLFAAKFDAVVHNARALIDVYLAEESRKTFDAGELDHGEVQPRVTIDQAIKISQLAARKREKSLAPEQFEGEAEPMDDDGMDAVRESVLGKLRRIREADRREQLALGWSFDESFDVMVPPGWIKGPDYAPKPPELPVDYYSHYRGGAAPPFRREQIVERQRP